MDNALLQSAMGSTQASTINRMGAGSPGQLTRGTRLPSTSTYVPGGDGSRQESVWSISALSAVQKYCDNPIPANQIVFSVDMGCVSGGFDAPLTATFNYGGETGAALIAAIAATLNLNPNINALGVWAEDGGNLKFVSAFSGINIKLSAVYSNASFTVAQLTNLVGAGYNMTRFKPGRIVHYVPGENGGVSGRRSMYLPTQDPSLPASNQRFAGIVLECDMHEMAPASGTYPGFSNCGSDCAPMPSCYRVLDAKNAPVVVEIEGGQDASLPLHYRIAAGLDGSELGIFRFGEASGCILVPFDYTILSFDFGSQAVEIEMR
jgi:hypothetical protein